MGRTRQEFSAQKQTSATSTPMHESFVVRMDPLHIMVPDVRDFGLEPAIGGKVFGLYRQRNPLF